MSKMEIAYLELFTVGGTGILLIVLGILSLLLTKKRNASCTVKTEGTVIRHKFSGKGRMSPVVSFQADGREIQTVKKYNSIRSARISGIPIPTRSDAWEDGKGNLYVKTGPIANMRQLAENLWPIGSQMTVYYNPENVKINYVDRPITNGFLAVMFSMAGILCVVLGSVIFFLMH